jgi:hypothetical protein
MEHRFKVRDLLFLLHIDSSTKRKLPLIANHFYSVVNEHRSVKNWNEVASLLPGRTNKDCRKRWSKVRLDIKKGAWTPDEDERLQQAVAQVGFKLVTPSLASLELNAFLELSG